MKKGLNILYLLVSISLLTFLLLSSKQKRGDVICNGLEINVDTNMRREIGIKVIIPLEATVDITASNAGAQMKRAKQFVESKQFVHLTLPDVESRINILVTEDETISLTAHDLG